MSNKNSCFRVIKIIDDMSIVLNCGEKDDIKEGTRFYIYSENGTPVIDPFTNENLGSFKGIKAKVEATTVYEKMCICKNSQKLGGFADLSNYGFSSLIGKRVNLNVDPTQISGGLDSSVDELIRIGDEAELIK